MSKRIAIIGAGVGGGKTQAIDPASVVVSKETLDDTGRELDTPTREASLEEALRTAIEALSMAENRIDETLYQISEYGCDAVPTNDLEEVNHQWVKPALTRARQALGS